MNIGQFRLGCRAGLNRDQPTGKIVFHHPIKHFEPLGTFHMGNPPEMFQINRVLDESGIH
jgi:hypothetical protein